MRWQLWIVVLLAAPALAEDPPPGVLLSGEATLFDRSKHNDYEKATFSFEFGIRDDPGGRITRNDWDVQFSGGSFHVNMVTDDRSRILDLGAKKLSALKDLPAMAAGNTERVLAVEGHAYLVHTRDTETDQVAIFRVRQFVAGDRVVIEWVRFERLPDKNRLPMDAATRAQLSTMLAGARDSLRAQDRREIGTLDDPEEIRLQIRTGAQGGNRSRLALSRLTYRLPDRPAAGPLEFRALPNIRDDATWFWKGGYLPDGKALVVDVVDVLVQAKGDSNGRGEAVVVVGSQRVLSLHRTAGPYRIWFEGRAVIRPGEEDKLFVEVANSSAVDMRVIGHLIPLVEADKVQPRPFRARRAPEGIKRVGRGVVAPLRWLLQRPQVVLQIRGGANGGNRRWIDMIGGSYRLDATGAAPLALDKPVGMRDAGVAFCDGGRVPEGKIFVVTRIEYRASAKGDSNGSGEVFLKVGDTTIFRERDKAEPIQGVWTGDIELIRGEERQVRLQIGNSSFADVKISGRFVDFPDK